MGPAFTRKYNTLLVAGTTAIRIPMIKRAVVDYAVGADWTPAAGDVKIAVDNTAPANVTNLPTAVASGNGAFWEFILTAAELSCKQAVVTIVDAATKAVEDNAFIVETFGNASAMYQLDLSDAVRLGLTALPNAAAGANGGLPLGDANGRVDLSKVLGSAINALIAGRVDANAQVVGDKTGYTLSAAGVQAVWDALTSALTTVGSIGKRIADNLDAAVSSRSTYAGADTAGTTTLLGRIAAAITITGGKVDVNDKTGFALTAAEETAIADALLKRDMSAVAGEASRSPLNALRFLRNKWNIAGGTLTVTKEDDATAAWTGAVTTTAGDPVSQIDPA